MALLILFPELAGTSILTQVLPGLAIPMSADATLFVDLHARNGFASVDAYNTLLVIVWQPPFPVPASPAIDDNCPPFRVPTLPAACFLLPPNPPLFHQSTEALLSTAALEPVIPVSPAVYIT